MAKESNDIVAINVNIDKELADLLTTVCKITGKTKKAVVEEGISKIITPFCSYVYNEEDDSMKRICKPRKGLYITDNESEIISECIILEDTSMLGDAYVKIYKDGQLQKVPAQYIREVSGV